MNKKILFLILLVVLASPTLALAGPCGDVPCSGGGSGGGGATVGGMAQAIAGVVVIVGTWIVVIMWVMTGILFLIAQGDPSKLNSAKIALFSAIGGTILIILANGAMSFVANSFGL
ncbi:MAG: hypothetical protein NTY81_03985 [Candidatus Staskawiczbacteria bacterium]|nr:hypothetical protein [Candidatus Staskawiczbacteria bacterium]